jgi:hypothetical protein
MYVIHMLRKPLGEPSIVANVETHGTGAVNIDGSRLPSGGFGANVILVHKAGCSKSFCAKGCPIPELERVLPGASGYFKQVRIHDEPDHVEGVPGGTGQP